MHTFYEILINKRLYDWALDMHLYGHMYYNVIDHPEFLILHSNMPLARVVNFLDLEIVLAKS